MNNKDYKKYLPFNFFSFLHSNNLNLLYRWSILAHCFKEMDPENNDLSKLSPQSQLYVNIKERLCRNCQWGPSTIDLPQLERNKLNEMQQKYKIIVQETKLNILIVDLLLVGDYINAVKVLAYSFGNLETEYQLINNHRLDILKLFTLVLASEINKLIMQKNFEKSLELLRMLSLICVEYFEKKNLYVLHVFRLLSFTYKEMKETFSEAIKTNWELFLKTIETQVKNFKENFSAKETKVY